MSAKIRAWAMDEVFTERPYKRNDWLQLQKGNLDGFYACEDYEHLSDTQLLAEVNKLYAKRMAYQTRQERDKLPKNSGISVTWKHPKYTMGQVVRDWFINAVSVRNHTYHDGSVFVQLLNEKGQIVSSFEPSTISNIEYHAGAAS